MAPDIGRYHEEQLWLLLEHVREGFTSLTRARLTRLSWMSLIHRYKRSARELWKFCVMSGSGGLSAARMLQDLEGRGDEPPGWWAAGEPPRR